MKKIIFCFSFLLALGLSWDAFSPVEAQTLTDSKQLFGINADGNDAINLKGETLPDYTAGANSTETQFRAIVEIFIVWLKRIMMPVAIAFMTWGGLKLILSRGDEEQVFTQRRNESFAIATGFLLFLISKTAVDKVFFGFKADDPTYAGAILRNGNETLINEFGKQAWIQLEGIFDFATSFIVVVATLYLIVTAMRMLLSFGNEEAMSELKNKLIYTTLGLALVISIKQIVLLFTKVRYGALDNPDTSGIIQFFAGWSNVILGFLGLLAVIALIWAGFILIAGFGDDSRKETAQNIVKYVIIGLVLAFSAWTIVYYFTSAGNA